MDGYKNPDRVHLMVKILANRFVHKRIMIEVFPNKYATKGRITTAIIRPTETSFLFTYNLLM